MPSPEAKRITSSSNASYKKLASLLRAKGIEKENQALVSGPKFIADILKHYAAHAHTWVSDSTNIPPPTKSLQWLVVTKDLFKELDISGTKSPLLVVTLPKINSWQKQTFRGCTLVVPFQNPENVGAIIRTAAAFNVNQILLTKEASHPFLPKSIRSAGPTLFSLPLYWGPYLAEITLLSTPIITLDSHGKNLRDVPFPKDFALVPGLEGPGLPPSLRDCESRAIPISHNVESLNAAAATTIALYVWASFL